VLLSKGVLRRKVLSVYSPFFSVGETNFLHCQPGKEPPALCEISLLAGVIRGKSYSDEESEEGPAKTRCHSFPLPFSLPFFDEAEKGKFNAFQSSRVALGGCTFPRNNMGKEFAKGEGQSSGAGRSPQVENLAPVRDIL